jgi:hypothetical protein
MNDEYAEFLEEELDVALSKGDDERRYKALMRVCDGVAQDGWHETLSYDSAQLLQYNLVRSEYAEEVADAVDKHNPVGNLEVWRIETPSGIAWLAGQLYPSVASKPSHTFITQDGETVKWFVDIFASNADELEVLRDERGWFDDD